MKHTVVSRIPVSDKIVQHLSRDVVQDVPRCIKRGKDRNERDERYALTGFRTVSLCYGTAP